MDQMKYALLDEVLGRWMADVIENFLKSEGIDVVLIEGTVSDLFTPSFAAVKIYVPKEDVQRARELLEQFNETHEES
jgi:hypothetical protein